MITSEATPDQVEVQIEIRASCERVFDALVDPNELAKWWGDSQMYRTWWEVDLRAGGQYECRATAVDGGKMKVNGHFLEIERPRKVGMTWNASWDGSGETTVTYEMTRSMKGTLLKVTQKGFGSGADQGGYQDGWSRVFGWLAGWVERGETT
jgi:uncharacterized protein YndB with AHSA1/START domain